MSDLEALVRAQRAAVLLLDRQLATDLIAAYSSAWQRIRSQLDPLTADIAVAGDGASLGWLARQDRLRQLEQQIIGEVGAIAQRSGVAITTAQWQAVALAQEHAKAAVALAMGEPPAGVFASFAQLPADAVRALVSSLAPGEPLAALLDSLGPEAAKAVKTALENGVILGHGPAQIAREARAAFGGNAVRALTVSRTEVHRAYRQASWASYRQNSDVVKGWIWMASLSRSCAACVAKHGSRHTLDEELHDHPRGRCAALPDVRTWAELGYDVPDAAPAIVKTGPEWFADQAEDVQARILSPAKLAAYRTGDLAIEDLAGVSRSRVWGRSLTERSLTDVVGKDRARELIAGARA